MNRIAALLFVANTFWACNNSPNSQDGIQVGKSLDSMRAGVACAHPVAAEIGARILKQGEEKTVSQLV